MTDTQSRQRVPWAPLLVAWYLALSLLTELGGSIDWRDALGTLTYATLTAVAAWGVSRLMARDRHKRALCAAILVLWFGLFGTFRLIVSSRNPGFPLGELGILLAWTGAFALLLILVARGKGSMEHVVKALTVALALLIAVPALSHVRRLWAARAPQTDTVGAWSVERDPAKPDVYLILLDKYSHPRWLSEHYGLDVGPFVDSLRALGFVIPERPRTNYIHTQLALAALLNSRMVHEELGSTSGEPWAGATALIEGAAVWDTFREHGYRLAFLPTGFPATQHGPQADLTMEPPAPLRSTIGRSWVLNTPVDLLRRAWCRVASCDAATLFPYPIEPTDAILWKMSAIATLPDSAGPIFAFVHFLGSHEPYQFGAECQVEEPWWPTTDLGADSARLTRAYAAQISCVNRMVLAMVTDLIARSAVPPVILLQSDHGHGRIAIDPVRGITLSLAALPAARVAERLDVFAAYRFPGAEDAVHDNITPVNVMPLVMHALFGTVVVAVPDRSYWSTYQDALDLTEMPAPLVADTSDGS